MKKNILVFLMVVVISAAMLTVVFPTALFCQEEEEEEEPVQARPNPMAWKTLETLDTLKNLKITAVEKGRALQFDMKSVRSALEKVKLGKKVSISYINSNGMVYQLGTFAPVRGKKKRVRSGKEGISINPQPEPPGWGNIPFTKTLAVGSAVKGLSPGPAGKAKLVFKNMKGQVKAVVVLNAVRATKALPMKRLKRR